MGSDRVIPVETLPVRSIGISIFGVIFNPTLLKANTNLLKNRLNCKNMRQTLFSLPLMSRR
jgi:hypothetical protein